MPRSFQTRLTLAFVGIVALTLALVALVVINRLDDYFRERELDELHFRRDVVARLVVDRALSEAKKTRMPELRTVIIRPEIRPPFLNPDVRAALSNPTFLGNLATFARADVTLTVGSLAPGGGVDGGPAIEPLPDASFGVRLLDPVDPAQERDPTIDIGALDSPGGLDWGIRVELGEPFTDRAATIRAITGLIVVVGLIAMAVAVVVAALLSQRFTIPLRRLTDVSRSIAEGDLTSRVPADDKAWTTTELTGLARQFNTMADRLEESVAIIRRDRDRSRDFLADVSHELRTPIAAVRTFNELLRNGADDDPAARQEFLESSAVQLDRLDWLATNLLELSKLDSGLVLLDLRPDDIRSTVESAVGQAEPTARRRGIAMSLGLPDSPLRIRHDPPRVGQIVANLVGNGLKFTQPGGSVRVTVDETPDGGARIAVADTGVGIDSDELPHIFERFFRGSRANEARGTGSGLGLAIVKSIVDMHHGTIAVESRVGEGSRFVVELSRDPREEAARARSAPAAPDSAAEVSLSASGTIPSTSGAKMADSSPADRPALNREAAP